MFAQAVAPSATIAPGLSSRSAISSRPRQAVNARRCTKPRAAPVAPAAEARTMYDKIVADHVVHRDDDGTTLLYIDRHMIHEVTSPQAFEVRNKETKILEKGFWTNTPELW